MANTKNTEYILDYVLCPYCKKKFKELHRHALMIHGKSIQDLQDDYPGSPVSITKTTNKVGDYPCLFCDRKYDRLNALNNHYRLKHPEYFVKLKADKEKKYNHYKECPICFKKYGSMSQHVFLAHGYQWDKFCNDYNWDISKGTIFTEEHCKKLSDNKLKYYNSAEGFKRKQKQSAAIKGNKNMACRPEVRAKISNAAVKRIHTDGFFRCSYGIKVNFLYEGVNYHTRSFEEFKVMFLLLKNKIPFNYEGYSIKYKREGIIHNYFCDFRIQDTFIEIKACLNRYDKEKYRCIKNAFKKEGKKFRVETYNTLKKMLKLEENYDIFEECKQLLSKNNISFSYYTHCINSSILRKIDENYLNNKNIKIIKVGNKMVNWCEVESVEVNEHDGYVYDIQLEKNHYFAANNIISHNCRLKNDISDVKNDFSYSLGAGGESTGSKKVITINYNRMIQNKTKLADQVSLVHKYLHAYNEVFREYLAANMLPVFKAGLVDFNKLYLTIGLNGVLEAAEFLGFEISNNPEYINWLSEQFKEIAELNREFGKHNNLKINTECVPGENLGIKFANWDKKDGYIVPRDCYNSYFYKVEDQDLSIIDKFYLMGKDTCGSLDGGSALHANLEEYPTKEGFKKLLTVSVKTGCPYFCFNIKITVCNDCGNIDKHTLQKCPKCNSTNIDYATRIIGYLKKISSFSAGRKIEAAKRHYNKC